jgi:hypothetical protein
MKLTRREQELQLYELRSERNYEVWYNNLYTGVSHPLEASARERMQLLQANHYVFRNHPCSIVPAEKLWCVQGGFRGFGSGVLEWCWDQKDAEAILAKMKKDWRCVVAEAVKYIAKESS